MILSFIKRLLAIAVLLFLGSHAPAQTVTLQPQEQAIANDMVNSPGQGRPYMVLDPIIESVARAYAEDMANRDYFSDVNPNGVAEDYLLLQAGYQLPAWWGTSPTANYVASIAAGSSSPSVTWAAWMNSPPHKEHILAQNSFFAGETHYGVGYAYNPNSTYQYYWVIITAPPQPLAITTPAPASRVTTPTVAIAGTTDPGASPESVQFRVENSDGIGAYQAATGVANWSGTAGSLTSGTNLIRVQSLDGSGNVIDERTRDITYIVEGTLTVSVSGSGSVTSGFAGATTQVVGKSITLRATPAPGSIFAGWTGSIVSGSASVTFSMQNGLSLQANFQPNPFTPVSGAYYGILTTGSGAQSGLVRLSISSTGLFTGRVQIPGAAWSFTGMLDASGSATVTIPGSHPVTITLRGDLTDDSGQVTGTLSYGEDTFGFSASESTFSAITNAAPEAGRYTLVLPPNPATTGTSVPQGYGYAAIVVGANGAATVTGCLADGTPYSATGWVANDGTLALYCVPSGAPARSSLNGLLTFSSTDISDISGTLAWTRGPQAGGAYYPAGFVTQLASIGSRYVRPTAGLQPMDVSPGPATADFGDGNIPQPINIPVIVNQANQATMATRGLPDVTLSINPVSGAVSGSFVLPGGNVARGVRGVVFQRQQSAFGYFRGLNQYGYFSLTPGS